MPTWKLTIEYKGTRYLGWQEQKQGRTVQGALKAAAKEFFGEEVDLGGSGRTDAGVHALGQVAHLRALRKYPVTQIHEGLNSCLPADIHVLRVEQHPERFHARHSAISRSYLYQISKRRTAFAKDYVWWVKSPLDLSRMEAAARLFVGRHDFYNFTEKPAEQGSTLVVVEDCRVQAAGDLVLVRLVASHFLWKMVRRIVGVLVQTGLGSFEAGEVKNLMGRRPAETGQWTAPAAGLFLERVIYAGDTQPQLLVPAFALLPA